MMDRKIELANGRGYALVDEEDYELVSQYKWCLLPGHRTDYAQHSIRKGKTQLMHRLITGYKQTDHINGDGLDNRRCNLRPATHHQNGANQRIRIDNISGFKGVYFRKGRGYWVAQIGVDGKTIHLGHFDNRVNAARAYDTAALEHFGEYARLNFADST
jgi:hypothetical protein